MNSARFSALIYFLCIWMAWGMRLACADELTSLVLPIPKTDGGMPLMQALKTRHTEREFKTEPLTKQMLSNLLWAAFGINRPNTDGRTAPSAHGAKEIDIYVVMTAGVYLYDAKKNLLQLITAKDIRAMTGRQDFVSSAPINLVYVADFDKFPQDSDEDKRFYSAADTGFISQNVYLYCASEGLATMVRAYIDKSALGKAM